jgi:hypothetical protein
LIFLQECQQDRDREAPQQTVDAQLQGVDQIALEVRRGHEAGKVFEAYPLAAPDALEGIVLLERDQHTAHRSVLEHQRQRHGRQQEQQVKLPMPFDVDPCVVQLAFCCQHSRFRRGRLCFHESFSSFLICLPFDLCFTFAPLNFTFFHFVCANVKLCNSFIPLKQANVNDNSWYTSKIIVDLYRCTNSKVR